MNVKQLMSQPVTTCSPQDNLHAAAQLMWDRDCGVLPVVDASGQVVGMITDRDICMGALLQGRPLRDIAVSQVMSKQVVSCGPDDAVELAEKRMREMGVRRLPVLTAAAGLVGLVSLSDLARAAVSKPAGKQNQVHMAGIATTLAALCQPRSSAGPSLRS